MKEGAREIQTLWKAERSLYFIQMMQANPDYKGVCHVALAEEGHCRPGEVQSSLQYEILRYMMLLFAR